MKRYFILINKNILTKALISSLIILIFLVFNKTAIAQVTHPDNYTLDGESFNVTYSTTSIIGVPMLTYKDAKKRLTFSGNAIRISQTEIGDQVTVTINEVPDLLSVTLTLLIPVINLSDTRPVKFWTKAIFTTHKTTIGGPNLVKGAVQSYRSEAVIGNASFVYF